MADQTLGPPLRDPFVGTNYRALRQIGAGTRGDVYAVEHLGIGREFAAKVLHARLLVDPRSRDRLRLEAQALGRLSHPNVVSVEGFETTVDGRPFMVMELLRGQTLARELEERRFLPVGLAVHYAVQLLSALEAVHGAGVVHREVTTRSVFLARSREAAVCIKLTDFGQVRILPNAPTHAPAPVQVPTETGIVLGTPGFSSPEGALGQTVDERADIYAAALVLYTMLAGRGPFDHAADRQALLDAQAGEVPLPPSHYAEAPVPAELDALLLKALDKDPQARPASAREFREQLERLTSLFLQPAGWLQTTQYSPAATEGDDANGSNAANPSAKAPKRAAVRLSRSFLASRPRSQRALAVGVLLAISGFIASAMAVVGVAALLRGGR